MKVLVTTKDHAQFLVEKNQLTLLDRRGEPTDAQETMVVLPILKPTCDLIYGNEKGVVRNLGTIVSVIYRP